MRSIRIFAKNMGDPYYEPTIVVHDIVYYAYRLEKYILYKHWYNIACKTCQSRGSGVCSPGKFRPSEIDCESSLSKLLH